MPKLRILAFCAVFFLAWPGGPAEAARCSKPADMTTHLALAVTGEGSAPACAWQGWLSPDFNPWATGSSENLPAIAAAIALYQGPVYDGHDWRGWWTTYFEAQLGLRNGDSSLPNKLRYYSSSESFSKIYWHHNVTSAYAVHYWAKVLQPDAALASLAERFLRVNFFVQALAAGGGGARAVYKNGEVAPWSAPPAAYTGPFVALAAGRTYEGWPRAVDMGFLLARATGLAHGSASSWEAASQRAIVTHVMARWPAAAAVNSYGLDATDRGHLRGLIQAGTVPPSARLNAVLGGIRTMNKLHFLGWDGVRCTLMESNNNRNTPPTPAMCWHRDPYRAGGREVHYITPYRDSRACVPALDAFVDLQAHYLQAAQPGGCSAQPADSQVMPIPSAGPAFHFVLPWDAPPVPPPTPCPLWCRLPDGSCDPDCVRPCELGCSDLCPRLCEPLP